MNYEDVVSAVQVYGLYESVKGSKYPMAVDLAKVNDEVTDRTKKLANAKTGSGHDNFLNGIVVQFDLDKAYISYVDERIIAIMKEKVKAYNELQEDIKRLREEGKDTTTLNDVAKNKYLEILYSNPAGFKLTARMTTNYRQLKTIYFQRKDHRLPEWRAFCKWIETLPHAEFIIGSAE